MYCPSCNSGPLKPTKLEPSMAAYCCFDCEGVLLSLLSYRLWRESSPGEAQAATQMEDVEAAETPHAMLCPKCRRIMVKFRFVADSRHRLDICSYCDEVWLDCGEWEYLKSRRIHGELPKVFTEPWQRKLREEVAERVFQTEWVHKLGPADYKEVRSIREWIDKHPDRTEILKYLARTSHRGAR